MRGEIDAGSGPQAVVCLHGWCCYPSDFALQAKARPDGVRIFAPAWIDRLIASEGEPSLHAIAQDIAHEVRQRGIEKPLLCGHSMGGFLATYLAGEGLLECQGVLVLDSSLPLPAPDRDRYLALTRRLAQADYESVFRRFARESFFAPQERGPRAEAIVAGMLERPHPLAVTLLEQVCTHDFDPALSRIEVPFHVVAAETGVLDLPALRARTPQATGERLPGTGHFLTHFAPDEVNRAIATCLA